MSERVMRAVALIEANDQASEKFQKPANTAENVAGKMKLVEKASVGLNKAMIRGGDVSNLTRAREALVKIRGEMQAAQVKAKQLSAAMKAGDAGAAAGYAKTQAEIKRLAASYDKAKMSAARAAQEFRAAKAAATIVGAPEQRAVSRAPVILPTHVQRRMAKAKSGAAPAAGGSPTMILPTGMGLGSLTGGIGAYGAYIAAQQAATRSASVGRSMSRTGITGDASVQETEAGTAALRRLARDTAMPFDQVQQGLDSIVASGRSFGDALRMIPSVVKTAQASGAEVQDIANSSTAMMDHMGISIDNLQSAQDMLAKGGQLGKFELKDAARYLPSMLPAAKATGMRGLPGLSRLSAVLQVIRGGTGTAEEAASSASNIFAKMESEETTKRFSKFGIDLRKEMAKARNEGRDLLETFVQLTRLATKGDLSKIPQLFSDMEMARGMRPLVEGWEKVAKLQREISQSSGTVAANLKRITADSQAQIDRLSEAKDRAMTSAGDTLLSLASNQLEGTIKELNAIADRLDRFNATKKEKGLTAAVTEAAKEAAIDFMGSDIVFRTAPGGEGQAQKEANVIRRQSDLRKAIHARQTQGYRGGPTEAQLQAELDGVDETARRIHQRRAATRKGYGTTMARLNWTRDSEPLTAGISPGTYAGVAAGGSPGSGITAFPASTNMFPAARKGWGAPAPKAIPQVARQSGGTVEAIVKPDQVVAKLDGSVPVTGEATIKVPVTVTVNDGTIKGLIRAEVSEQVGKMRVHSNGAGSTGVSSPDAQ